MACYIVKAGNNNSIGLKQPQQSNLIRKKWGGRMMYFKWEYVGQQWCCSSAWSIEVNMQQRAIGPWYVSLTWVAQDRSINANIELTMSPKAFKSCHSKKHNNLSFNSSHVTTAFRVQLACICGLHGKAKWLNTSKAQWITQPFNIRLECWTGFKKNTRGR